jgi:hypothetical protein
VSGPPSPELPLVSLILINSAVIVKKASSTLDAFFAEVSKKGICKLSANAYNTKQQ